MSGQAYVTGHGRHNNVTCGRGWRDRVLNSLYLQKLAMAWLLAGANDLGKHLSHLPGGRKAEGEGYGPSGAGKGAGSPRMMDGRRSCWRRVAQALRG